MRRPMGRYRTGAWRIGPLTPRRALMLLFLGTGLRCVFVANQQPTTGTALGARVLAVACIAIAVGVMLIDIRLRGLVGHLLVVGLIIVTTVLVAVAPNRGDAILRAWGYPWSALFAALYMSRNAARSYAALASVTFAVGIAANGLPRMLSAWVLVTVTVLAVTAATSGLVSALRQQSEADPLTGITNRAGFIRLADQAMSNAARQRQTVAVVMCDIDGFKWVNDHHGHAAGDALLHDVAREWVTTLRASDVFGRIGGDEFAVLLPNTDVDGAEEAVARLRAATSVAFSAGAAVGAPGEPLDEVLARADVAMYADKEVRRATSTLPEQRIPRRIPATAQPAPTH